MKLKTPVLTRRLFGASTLALSAVAGTAMAAKAKKETLPYKDASLTIDARVADLLGRMTLEEKVAQLLCVWQKKGDIQDATGKFDPAKASKVYPNGLGMVARPSDQQGLATTTGAGDSGAMGNRNAFNTASHVNAMQKWAIEETRLGIPMIMHEEGLHGYVAKDATSFPQAIGLASSFDPPMATKIFSVAAREMRARGANFALAPVVDVAREPRWGRIEETYGEDPYLCGEMGKAAVIGFQGETLPLAKDKVFATLKHMTGHGQPENGTNVGPAEVSERTLREDFFPPFEKIVKETQIRAVMPSYNEIDGVPSHANKWLLTTILRDEWGFKGVTVSDYFAINEMISRHKLVPNVTEAAFRAFKAGVDIETPDNQTYGQLIELVKAGRISEDEINAVVHRILEMKFQSGLFENPYVDAKKADALTATPDAVALAHEAATKSVVLLKNNGVLPLDAKKVGKLLVLGTHAKDTPIGGYSDVPRHVVSILEGVTAEGKKAGFEVAYSEGVRITEQRIWGQDAINFTPDSVNDKLIADAVEAAKSADTILLVLGDNEQTSREAWADNHLGDRDSLDLMGRQNDLAAAIFALKKPTVVFLLNGRPLSVNLLNEKADALVEGWYMGQETGWAAADILFGRANPGGKLPVSIARGVGQLPVFYNHKPTARRGYLDGETSPLFPFGYGLSYTTFDISAPKLAKASIATTETVTVSIDVANTGKVKGDEVVQLYIRDDISSVTRPVKELKRFKRITLNPGERQTVSFDITPADLQFYNMDMQRVVEPGTFTISAGPNSVDLKTATLTVI
ncbi:glycoside hydrolase family 3 N-terminal domain-containing protein [Asticcacaulis benevestitus]|uniref:beta-glucosidase n=1 Tax=Asticcacaulis benevestitus DSM 16100 = ATCC BAA-896 TaxID=1121022 RepID=V4R0N9_9CAUL|nr:glycoside hydrolase family 3 N-terminal domain-containing protein [Asticcacaulis benevestitus]ESQ84968.1 glycoside hydrolase [Asticcacaulis benevestitus DSM 16100 = ATCC BAA-896]